MKTGTGFRGPLRTGALYYQSPENIRIQNRYRLSFQHNYLLTQTPLISQL
jgi:hypothetical protein